MATPPTLIAENETAWNTTTTPKSPSALSVTAGDILVACAVCADSNGVDVNLTVSGGTGVTWTQKQRVLVGSNTNVVIYTGATASTTSVTPSVQIANLPGAVFGATFYQFRGSDGVGASNKANGSGAPSVANVNTGANSAVVAVSGDWAAIDGTTRTWRTVNGITPTIGNSLERVYFRDAGGALYTLYSAYWDDAGAAGSKTVGLSAPVGQTWAICSVEIFGTTSAPADDTLRGGTMGQFSQTLDGRLWY